MYAIKSMMLSSPGIQSHGRTGLADDLGQYSIYLSEREAHQYLLLNEKERHTCDES